MFPIKCKVPELVPKQTLESTPVKHKILVQTKKKDSEIKYYKLRKLSEMTKHISQYDMYW